MSRKKRKIHTMQNKTMKCSEQKWCRREVKQDGGRVQVVVLPGLEGCCWFPSLALFGLCVFLQCASCVSLSVPVSQGSSSFFGIWLDGRPACCCQSKCVHAHSCFLSIWPPGRPSWFIERGVVQDADKTPSQQRNGRQLGTTTRSPPVRTAGVFTKTSSGSDARTMSNNAPLTHRDAGAKATWPRVQVPSYLTTYARVRRPSPCCVAALSAEAMAF